jgi:hypothetical protein
MVLLQFIENYQNVYAIRNLMTIDEMLVSFRR